MAFLKGKAPATFDAKGRVSLPAKYRRLLPEDLVVAISPDEDFPALVVYTQEGFEKWTDEILVSKGGYRANNKSHDQLIDKYVQDSEDVDVDSVGRILIPSDLRGKAKINKDVMFSGARDHLVIRSIAIWQEYQKALAMVTVYDENPIQA
ncbi:MAG: division/cell wall cluster transcriptional repressor MraZ [Coriobacteriia bacterium]|nr:division/cell wall cluster transcriptional repressor MraZ [Coriobacteriia bacterium]